MVLGAVLLVAVLVQLRLRRAPEYGLTVIWALVAVIVANGQANLTVSGVAAVGIVILALSAVRTVRN